MVRYYKMKTITVLVALFLLYNVIPAGVRSMYEHHGHGDQLLTFGVVFASFLTPLLWPILHFKTLAMNIILPAANLGWVEAKLTYTLGRALLTPSEPFHPTKVPAPPDYSNEDYWSMLPNRSRSTREDAGDVIVGDEADYLKEKICSAFYLFVETEYYKFLILTSVISHPSTWYTSVSWNADALHPVTSYLSDDAIGPQHANAFNVACRIFAPRFRQMAAAGFLQEMGLEDVNSKQALDLAYSDVKVAFTYFLKHYHKGEPIVLVGHSQGSLHGARLLKDFFEDDENLYKYLGAAYLPGWTLFEDDFKGRVQVCRNAEQVGCVISWRTFANGGDVKAFLHIAPKFNHYKSICTNPLTWTTDEEYVPETANLGGLDVMHYYTMWRYLIGYRTPKDRVRPPALIPNITDAQCVGGHLMVSPPRHYGYGWGFWPFPAWTFASFPGQNLHTYDFNFFFGNVRQNIKHRMKAWHTKNGSSH